MKKKSLGQSLLEFGLVLPLLALMITAFLDLGRGYYYYTALSNSVREGARYAVVSPIPETGKPSIEQVVQDFSIALDPALMEVTVQFDDPSGTNSYSVTVVGSYDYAPVTPGVQLIIGAPGTIPLTSQTTMKLTPYGNFLMSSSP